MNAKDETNDQSIVLEDLSAENAEATQVKGGVKLEEVLFTGWQTSDSGGSGIG